MALKKIGVGSFGDNVVVVVVDVVVVVVAVDSEVVSFCCPQSCSQVSIAKL